MNRNGRPFFGYVLRRHSAGAGDILHVLRMGTQGGSPSEICEKRSLRMLITLHLIVYLYIRINLNGGETIGWLSNLEARLISSNVTQTQADNEGDLRHAWD